MKNRSSKERLLEVAQQLFSEKSYEEVSTRELAEAAEVNLGAIQYYFGSKAKLFVEAIRALMTGQSCSEAHEALFSSLRALEGMSEQDERRRCGALGLCQFIRLFLRHLVLSSDPQPCRIMFREIYTNTVKDVEMFEALTSSVVNDFIEPVDRALLTLLGEIDPARTRQELEYVVQSIIGQCTYYVTHRPFTERLRGIDIGTTESLEAIATHIGRFTLLGMNCPQEFVAGIIEETSEIRGSRSLEERSL